MLRCLRTKWIFPDYSQSGEWYETTFKVDRVERLEPNLSVYMQASIIHLSTNGLIYPNYVMPAFPSQYPAFSMVTF
jgi:hypothetical protein